jgi:DNA-binding GntR family transcriptional regulator
LIENNYCTLTETIYQNIKELIINGKYKSGSRLLLNNLSSEMNVSITPVREALKKMEKDGLVKIIPNKGAIVISLTFRDVIEIYDLRKQLELLAVELFIKNKKQNELDELSKICDEDDNYLRNGDLNSHIKCNYKFHMLLIKSGENKRLINYYNELNGQLSILVSRTISFAGEPKKSADEHKKIIEALRQENVELAKKIIQNHIQNAKEDILNRSIIMSKSKKINYDTEIDEVI